MKKVLQLSKNTLVSSNTSSRKQDTKVDKTLAPPEEKTPISVPKDKTFDKANYSSKNS